MTPQGSQLFNSLLNFGNGVISDPMAGLQPITNAGMENINSGYGNIPGIVSKSMASRGYGSSGTEGDAMYKAQLARLGSISNFQGQMADLASRRQFQAGDLMDNMLRTQIGQTGTSKTTEMDPFQALMGLGTMLTGFNWGGGGSPDSFSSDDLTALMGGETGPDAGGGFSTGGGN